MVAKSQDKLPFGSEYIHLFEGVSPLRLAGFTTTNICQMEQAEKFFTCPYCLQRISMLLDLSVDSQTFIEDCEVCCNPIEIFYNVEAGQAAQVTVRRLQ